MKNLKRNRVFELLGAKPTNPRWSWCALSSNQRGAIFTLWEDEIRDGRSRLSWEHYEAKTRLGAADKKRILEIVMQNQIPAYGLICVASDPKASPRSIKEIKGDFLIRLQIERREEGVFGKHVGQVYILEAAREISGSPASEDDGLRDLDEEPSGSSVPDRAIAIGVRVVRDPKIRAYVLRHADGSCEYCGERGFQMKNGQFYVEAHHVLSLSDDGRDTVDNVIALCPKHHREAHYGVEAEVLEQKFIDCIKARKKKPNQSPQRNAGSRPVSNDSPAPVTPSVLAPRG